MTAEQKHWTVDEVEHWMSSRRGPQIDFCDRVSWRCADGDIIDMNVGGYVRARNKWASRPLERYCPRS
jgi:hypothetical protein